MLGKDTIKRMGRGMYTLPDVRGGLDGIVAGSPRGENGVLREFVSLPTSPSPERCLLEVPAGGTHARRATIRTAA